MLWIRNKLRPVGSPMETCLALPVLQAAVDTLLKSPKKDQRQPLVPMLNNVLVGANRGLALLFCVSFGTSLSQHLLLFAVSTWLDFSQPTWKLLTLDFSTPPKGRRPEAALDGVTFVLRGNRRNGAAETVAAAGVRELRRVCPSRWENTAICCNPRCDPSVQGAQPQVVESTKVSFKELVAITKSCCVSFLVLW